MQTLTLDPLVKTEGQTLTLDLVSEILNKESFIPRPDAETHIPVNIPESQTLILVSVSDILNQEHLTGGQETKTHMLLDPELVREATESGEGEEEEEEEVEVVEEEVGEGMRGSLGRGWGRWVWPQEQLTMERRVWS